MKEKLRSISLSERIDPQSTALVIVDVQNDFCDPDGLCGQLGDDVTITRPMVENVQRLLEAARKSSTLVVFIRTSYDVPVLSEALAEQYQRRGFPNSVCLEGTMGVQFVDGIKPSGSPSEIVVTKHRYSAFWGSNIDLVLRSNGIRTVIITGISTDICVESTSRDAFFRDYFVVVVSDAVTSFSSSRHDATLAVLGRAFGEVTKTDTVVQVWTDFQHGSRGWQFEVKSAELLRPQMHGFLPQEIALLLIDLQNDFCSRDGQLAASGSAISRIESALPRTHSLMLWARKTNIQIVHINSEYGEETWNIGSPVGLRSDGGGSGLVCHSTHKLASQTPVARTWQRMCVPGTWGAQPLAGFQPQEGDHSVFKNRFSGFVGTSLDLRLRANDIRCVLLAGVTTTCAIDSTARDAAMNDYFTIVLDDCVADVDERADLHEVALKLLEASYARLISSRDLPSLWNGQR